MATTSEGSLMAAVVTADAASPQTNSGRKLLLPINASGVAARLEGACGSLPARLLIIGCLALPAAYVTGAGRNRCRRRARCKEPVPGLAPEYRGSFTHPAFEYDVFLVVKLEAPYWGWWRALGQTEEISICCAGSAVSLREVTGTTVLEGIVQGKSGTIVGTVVQDGVRGGDFTLTPAEGCTSIVAPDTFFVEQLIKHAGSMDAPPTESDVTERTSDITEEESSCQDIRAEEPRPLAQARRVPEFCTCAACRKRLARSTARAELPQP